jgi:hypothetical protein
VKIGIDLIFIVFAVIVVYLGTFKLIEISKKDSIEVEECVSYKDLTFSHNDVLKEIYKHHQEMLSLMKDDPAEYSLYEFYFEVLMDKLKNISDQK